MTGVLTRGAETHTERTAAWQWRLLRARAHQKLEEAGMTLPYRLPGTSAQLAPCPQASSLQNSKTYTCAGLQSAVPAASGYTPALPSPSPA